MQGVRTPIMPKTLEAVAEEVSEFRHTGKWRFEIAPQLTLTGLLNSLRPFAHKKDGGTCSDLQNSPWTSVLPLTSGQKKRLQLH